MQLQQRAGPAAGAAPCLEHFSADEKPNQARQATRSKLLLCTDMPRKKEKTAGSIQMTARSRAGLLPVTCLGEDVGGGTAFSYCWPCADKDVSKRCGTES